MVEDMAHTPPILLAIQNLQATIEGKMEELKVVMVLIQQDLRTSVTDVEGRLSGAEDTVKAHEERLVHLQRLVGQLEGRSRPNNLHIMGIPEGAEVTISTKLIYDCLQSWVPTDEVSNCFIITRAHRAMTPKPL
ncbi:hypothetical protein NDU88_009179 [Pleurodeles waltl]|uniref:Transposase n=1 Tax=Pleurodeles waltl TaxID=8319 RepID=A0AAV7RYA9_PLEWA|nr:hypothetical protein NDU88_009179 [Pleurodeles waltl]